MCDFLSGWINVRTHETAVATLRSHSDDQTLLGWKAADLVDWREWEWLRDDDGESLTVRTHPDDNGIGPALKTELLVRWKTRSDAILDCIPRMHPSVTTLNLWGATVPEKLKIPNSVTTLDLWGATVPEKLKIPNSVTTLKLWDATVPKKLAIPKGAKVLR